MIDVSPFVPTDLGEISLQPQQAAEMVGIAGWRDMAHVLVAAGPCWTMRFRGRVVACAGLGIHWPGRAEAWAFIAGDLPRAAWPALHRTVARGLAEAAPRLGLRRIEAACAMGWGPGARWLRMLGFELEGPLRAYGPDGRDFLRYARIA